MKKKRINNAFPYFHPGFHLEEETFTGCSNTNVYPFH